MVFKNLNSKDEIYENHKSILNELSSKLGNQFPVITKLELAFQKKIDDFYNEDRKLRIAVIGQVKAGKSSFLNTLLFNGEKILPTAATPKTATLTVIKYSEKNYLHIEFYTKEEWETLKQLSILEEDTDEIKLAKELMEMLKERDLNPEEYIGNDNYIIEFSSYDELLGKLNDYAGENGKFTPLVKALNMNVKNDKIRDIEIIDTPGLNDPIASRTDKTRQCIEFCDVVFFLSQAPSFLDKTDMELLARQLPQKGVNKMILIASKYDSALIDAAWNMDSLEEAEIDTKVLLKRGAKKNFESYISRVREMNPNSPIIKVIEESANPIFISSMTHNMSSKAKEEYDENEEVVYDGLSYHGDVSSEDLKRMGNFDELTTIFDEVIEQKEKMLLDKAEKLIPASVSNALGEVSGIKAQLNKKNELLQTDDIEKLKSQKKIFMSKKNNISSNVENIFGELMISCEKNKLEAIREIREAMREASSVSERTGTEEKTTSYSVSTSKWYNPFSWGSSETRYSTYTVSYNYIDISDVVENIRNYANDSSSSMEKVFNESINYKATKKELLRMIVENFDADDENFDPAYFKLMVEKTINSFETPIIKIDISEFVNKIASTFSGEIRDSSQKSTLRMKLSESLGKLFETMEKIFVSEINKFRENVTNIKTTLADTLLLDITRELDSVIEQFDNREKEIEKNSELIECIEGFEIKLK